MLAPGKRLILFSIRKTPSGSVWTRCGVVFVNKDESLGIRLNALPLDGTLYAYDADRLAGSTARPHGGDRSAA